MNAKAYPSPRDSENLYKDAFSRSETRNIATVTDDNIGRIQRQERGIVMTSERTPLLDQKDTGATDHRKQYDTSVSWRCKLALIVACMVLHAETAGLTYGLSVLLPELVRVYDAPRSEAALVQSLFLLDYLVAGMVWVYFMKRFGQGQCVVVGAFLSVLGLFICSLAQDLPTIIVAIGIISSAGFGCIYLVPFLVVTDVFEEKMSTMLVVLTLGSGVGQFMMPLIYEESIQEYGLSGTFLIMAAIAMHSIPCGLVIWVVLRIKSQKKERCRRHRKEQQKQYPHTMHTHQNKPSQMQIQNQNNLYDQNQNNRYDHNQNNMYDQNQNNMYHQQEVQVNMVKEYQDRYQVQHQPFVHYESTQQSSDVNLQQQLHPPTLLQYDSHNYQEVLDQQHLSYNNKSHSPHELLLLHHDCQHYNQPKDHVISPEDEPLTAADDSGISSPELETSFILSNGRTKCTNDDDDEEAVMSTKQLFISIVTDKHLVLLLTIYCLTSFSGNIENMFIVDIIKDRGMDRSAGSVLASMLGGANIFSRFMAGVVKMKFKCPTIVHWLYVYPILCLSHILVLYLPNYWETMAGCILAGIGYGMTVALGPSIMLEAAGVQRYRLAWAIVNCLFGIGDVLQGEITGLIRDVTGSYDLGFQIAAATSFTMFLQTIVSVVLTVRKARQTSEQTLKV